MATTTIANSSAATKAEIRAIVRDIEGADPLYTADVNTAAIQQALDVGGLVSITKPGIYTINKCLVVPGYTSFIMGDDVELFLESGAACNMVRNYSAQVALDSGKLTVAGSVATFNQPGHSYNVGDSVYVENVQGNITLNGVKTVATVNGNLWTFAASGTNPTNTIYQRIFVGPVNQIAGSNLVRTSNVVTVTETGHKRNAGDSVYVTGSSDSSFHGIHIVTEASGSTWKYASTGGDGAATGTANITGDSRINIHINKLNGNIAGNTMEQMQSIPLYLGNIGNSTVRANHIQDGGSRATNLFAANNVHIPYHYAAGGKGTLQMDSGCGTITVGDIESGPITDDVIAWGVTPQASPWGATSCPSGPKSMGRLIVGTINGITQTGQLKMFGDASYDLGTVIVGDIAGQGKAIADDAGLGPPTGQLLQIRSITSITPAASAQSQISVKFRQVKIGSITPSGHGSFFVIGTGADMGEVDIGVNDERYPSYDFAIATYAVIDRFILRGTATANATGILEYVRAINSGRIKDFIAEGLKLTTNAAGGASQSLVRLYGGNGGGQIDNAQLNNVHLARVKAINNTNGNYPHTIQFSNLNLEDCDQGFSDAGNTQQCVVTGSGVNAPVLNNYLLMPSGGGIKFHASGVVHQDGKALILWGTGVLQVNCASLRFSFADAVSGGRLGNIPGNMAWNTAAGYGAGIGMYGCTSAGTWTKVF